VVAHVVQQIAHLNQYAFCLFARPALASQADDKVLLFEDADFLLGHMTLISASGIQPRVR
jgi:hypothetical protein